MKLFVLTQSSVVNSPVTAPPFVTTNVEQAVQTWTDWVIESLGYPDDNADEDDIAAVHSVGRLFLENQDDPEYTLEWVVNYDGDVTDQITYALHTVCVPALTLLMKGKLK